MKRNIKITQLYIYPLKSAKGQIIDRSEVRKYGFEYDRRVAIIDSNGRIVTGREQPKLVLLDSKLDERFLVLSGQSILVTFPLPKNKPSIAIKLFRSRIMGIPFGKKANTWVSEHLGGNYRFVFLGGNYRTIPEKRGGKIGDATGFADSSPVHLINELSLDMLNSKLSDKVTIKNFRPNIVIRGNKAFEEDQWEKVMINGLEYRAQERTQRCIFTTVDPIVGKLDSAMEPLTSLAKMRSALGLRPTFGINIIPSDKGTVAVGDTVEVLDK